MSKTEALQGLDGLLLGDGGLQRHKYGAHYAMKQSKHTISIDDHLTWLQWIRSNIFEPLGVSVCNGHPKMCIGTHRGNLFRYAHLATCSSPLLVLEHDKWYTGGEKVYRGVKWHIRGATKVLPVHLTQAKVLSIPTIVQWFLGDGSSTFQYSDQRNSQVLVNFSTDGFSKEEVCHLASLLKNTGLNSTVRKHPGIIIKGSGFRVHLAQDSIDYFMDMIKPFLFRIFKGSESPSYRDMIKYKRR